jgi:hypothetical protein
LPVAAVDPIAAEWPRKETLTPAGIAMQGLPIEYGRMVNCITIVLGR